MVSGLELTCIFISISNGLLVIRSVAFWSLFSKVKALLSKTFAFELYRIIVVNNHVVIDMIGHCLSLHSCRFHDKNRAFLKSQ
jgi:hypothetical protein